MNGLLLYFNRLAKRASRVIAASQFKIHVSNLKFEIWIEGSKERKVRTPEGSEPANGGESERNFDSQISNLKFSDEDRSGDDKCNREKTSRPRFRF